MSQLISVAMDLGMLSMLRWLDEGSLFTSVDALRRASPAIYWRLRCFRNEDGFGFTVGHCQSLECQNCLLVSSVLASEVPDW